MRRFTSFALTTVSLAALTATPAFAQAVPGAPVDATPEVTDESEEAPPSSEPTNAQGEAQQEGDIVVTGSRIRRNNFNTPSPVTVVTRDDAVLAGTTSTAETLQSSTITSGTSQISGGFLGFVSEGGAAASTVGLRGIGSQRTLLLLNGRRIAPAGVGNQLVAADLNTLPTSVVQRIEVLREGASSIYGSDAIAGVINVITDTKVDGISVDLFGNFPTILDGDAGRTFRGSLTAGKTFDRGHILASFEYRQFEGMRQNDRDDIECPQDNFFQNGVEVGQFDPTTNEPRCFPFQFGNGGIASGYGLAFDFDVPGAFVGRLTYPGYLSGNPTIGTPVVVNNNNLRPPPHPSQLEAHLFSPIKTYTGYVNGAYELGALNDAELYGEILFTRRKSHQDNTVQISIDQGQLDPGIEVYGGSYAGIPLEAFGYPVSPFRPVAFDAFGGSGIDLFFPLIQPDQLTREKQRVDYMRANGGVRGALGFGDWRYDANVQISRTRARSVVPNPTSASLSNLLMTTEAPAGTPADFIVTALPGQVGAGTGYTCASNVTGGTYNGGRCVPLNFYDPAILLGGDLPQNLFDYLYVENINKSRFNQETLSLVFDGTLFELPAGAVRAAVGLEHRRDEIRDVPPLAARNGTLYNRAAAGITAGKDRVNEAFAEVNVPIIVNRPWVHNLEVALSGRYTDYRSYGSQLTYRLNAQYAPVEALRLRASYGTNFRAPNLYEQFVADQTGFFGGASDPCNAFGANLEPGNVVFDNCLAELTPILDDPATPQNEALAYIHTAGIEVTTIGGAGRLEAEKAKSWGLGAVLTLPRHIADFSLAVDYFNIKVKDEVNTLGTTILNLCYSAEDFPNNQYCDLIAPRAGPGEQRPGILTEFTNPFLNVAQQTAEGIDFNARFATRVLGGRFQTQLFATRMLEQGLEIFPGNGLFDFNGTLGFPGFGAGPKWTGSLDTRFTKGPWTFRHGLEYVGRQNSNIPDLVQPAFIGGQPVDIDLVAEAYYEHGISVQYKLPRRGQITVGINNLFNTDPPRISNSIDPGGQYFRIGNFMGGGPYDYLGRQVFINLTTTF